MANEIYHRSNWGESKPEGFGDMYFDSSATNKLYNRSTYYENSDATDKILGDIPNKASIVLTPTGYSEDKIGSAIPVDGNGDFTFARNSSATRVNQAGLIEASQSNDTPRLDYTTGEGAFLIEPQSTNLLLYSENFTLGVWQDEGGNQVVNTNVETSPSGTLTASKLTVSSGSINTRKLWYYFSTTIGLDYTYSVYIKAVDGQVNTGFISLATLDTHINQTFFTATDVWQRVVVTATANDTVTRALITGDANCQIFIWGAQLEQQSYATSYIPTVGSTVTRIADRANSSGNSDLFNDSEGVLYAEIASLAESVGNNKKFSISSGAPSNSILFSFRDTNNQIQVLVKSGGTNTVNSTPTISPAVTNFFKIAIKYKTDDFALFVNGTKVATDTSCAMPTGLNTLSFDRGDGGQDYIGKVKCVAVFKEALTDAELTQLTS